MLLKKLIKDLPIEVARGSKETEILGLCAHSQRVAPGDLFILKCQERDEGAHYVDEAIAAGATAILTPYFNPFLSSVVQLTSSKIKEIEGEIASRFYDYPQNHLSVFGVTGTNGKTTVSYLIKHFLDKLKIPTGLIGTIEYITGRQSYPAELTTPDPIMLCKLMREMVKTGQKAVVMEVSSIGLMQNRVKHIEFDVGIFTNLTQDHLDYHKTMELYAEAKALLFNSLKSDKRAVAYGESPWLTHILRGCSAPILTYGFSAQYDLWVDQITLSPQGFRGTLHFKESTYALTSKLVGRFNILNLLAALAALVSYGIDLAEVIPFVESFKPVSGRLERVPNQSRREIFIDYAHTEDALRKVLEALNEFKRGRIITVFGCGGNRDKDKRAKMGAVAEIYSDFTVVTSDNPRNEDPLTICQEVAQGFKETKHHIEIDRRRAIQYAIELAHPKDLILIAGKGHEAYQTFSHYTIPFDDREIVKDLITCVVEK